MDTNQSDDGHKKEVLSEFTESRPRDDHGHFIPIKHNQTDTLNPVQAQAPEAVPKKDKNILTRFFQNNNQ